MYETLKFIHVMSAIIWVGAGFGLFFLFGALTRAEDFQTLSGIGQRAEDLGKKLFMPASIVTLLAGIGMVLDADDLGFGEPFISIGFAAIILSIFLGAIGSERAATKVAELTESEGPQAASTVAARQRLRLMNGLDLLVLTVAVWAMVTKPFS